LPETRPASWYDPGRFWSGDHTELTPPYRLSGEIAVRKADGGSVIPAARASG